MSLFFFTMGRGTAHVFVSQCMRHVRAFVRERWVDRGWCRGGIGGSAKNLQHSPLCAFPPAAVPSVGPLPHILLTHRLLGTPARLPVRVAAAPGGGGGVFEGVRWRAIE